MCFKRKINYIFVSSSWLLVQLISGICFFFSTLYLLQLELYFDCYFSIKRPKVVYQINHLKNHVMKSFPFMIIQFLKEQFRLDRYSDSFYFNRDTIWIKEAFGLMNYLLKNNIWNIFCWNNEIIYGVFGLTRRLLKIEYMFL